MLALKGGSRVRERPFPSWPVWGREEEEALLDVLRSGKWGIGGKVVEEFAKEFASYQGCRYCVACANGTVAIKIALRALGIGDGSEVITTPYTFIATASAAIELGAIPVFADIDEETLNLDPASVEGVASERSSALIAVHIGGCPADMRKLMEIAAAKDLKVVEDAAQAHGAEIEGRRVGSIGNAGCFSFQSSKVITSGEGGAITTNDEVFAELCWSLVNCGRSRSGDWYEHELLGYNYRMTEFQAAILKAQLSRLDEQLELREANFKVLIELSEDLNYFHVLKPPRWVTRHTHHFVAVRADLKALEITDKRKIVEALNAEGIPCSPGYTIPLHKFKPIVELQRRRGVRQEELPNAERACKQVIWFPHNVLLDGEEGAEDIYKALKKLEMHRDEL